MRRMILIAVMGVLASVVARAQATSLAEEPSKFSAFIGAGLNAEGRVKPAGAAGLLASLGGKLYSYTGLSVRGITDTQPVTSAVQGFLYKVQDTDKLDIYAQGNGGVAQSVDVTSGDFSAGGVVAYKLRDNLELFLGLAARAAPAAGGVSPAILLGFHLGSE